MVHRPEPEHFDPDHRPGPPSGGRGWIVFLVGAALVTGLIFFLVGRYPDALGDRDGRVSFVHIILILAFVGSGVIYGRRIGFGMFARSVLIWGAIGAALILGYSYRFELQQIGGRMLGELMPSRGVAVGEAVSFRAGSDGHFHVEAMVNDTRLRFLVDTGASDIVLRPADARRLGFDPASLDFTRIYQTANGTVRGAPVRLETVELGQFRFRDLRASVNEADMGESLLGISFLERFGAYEVRNGTLTLYP